MMSRAACRLDDAPEQLGGDQGLDDQAARRGPGRIQHQGVGQDGGQLVAIEVVPGAVAQLDLAAHAIGVGIARQHDAAVGCWSANAQAGSVDWGTSGLGDRKGMTANEPSAASSGGLSTGKPMARRTSPAVSWPTPQRGV